MLFRPAGKKEKKVLPSIITVVIHLEGTRRVGKGKEKKGIFPSLSRMFLDYKEGVYGFIRLLQRLIRFPMRLIKTLQGVTKAFVCCRAQRKKR